MATAMISVNEAINQVIDLLKKDLLDDWLRISDELKITCRDYIDYDERHDNHHDSVLMDIAVWKEKCAEQSNAQMVWKNLL